MRQMAADAPPHEVVRAWARSPCPVQRQSPRHGFGINDGLSNLALIGGIVGGGIALVDSVDGPAAWWREPCRWQPESSSGDLPA